MSFNDCSGDRTPAYLREDFGEDAFGERALVELVSGEGVAGIDAGLSTSGSSSTVLKTISGTITRPDGYDGEVCVIANPINHYYTWRSSPPRAAATPPCPTAWT